MQHFPFPLTAPSPVRAPAVTPRSPRWNLGSVAAAVALLGGLHSSGAWALELGRVAVRSGLGEPLQAELEITRITAEERASLQIGVAPATQFQAANVERSPVLNGVTFEVVQRPDGRTVVRIGGNQAVTTPFVDLLVQAQSSSGTLQRSYTLLFDPPDLRTPPSAPEPVPAATTATTSEAADTTRRTAAAPRRNTATPQAATRGVRVRTGDTASELANARRYRGVSLDQMLVGMLRANPNAFIDNNINRLKTGAVLDVPSRADVAAINPDEARQLIAAQSRDFNEFRRRLAGAAQPQQANAERQASGQVQTEVSEPKAAATPADKLTLSKPTAPAAAPTPEDKIAADKQQAERQAREAELNRNLQELQKIDQATANTEAPTTAPEVAPPPPEVQAPEVPSIVPPLPTVVPLPEPTEAPTPAPTPEPESLWTNPWVLGGAGGLAATALGGLAFWRWRQRKQAQTAEEATPFAAALAAATPPTLLATVDDETDGATEAAALTEAPTEVATEPPTEAVTEAPSEEPVDPVAEADVFLSYGRDRQAEEILLEALRTEPDRLEIYHKLLDIQAQRGDQSAFEALAKDVYALTQGDGPDWEVAREMGYALDPDNPLYRGRDAAAALAAKAAADAAARAAAEAAAPPTLDFDLNLPPAAEPATDAAASDFDFNFDDDNLNPAPAAAPTSNVDDPFNLGLDDTPLPAPTTAPASTAVADDMDFDFDLDDEPPPPATTSPNDIGLNFDTEPATPAPTEPVPEANFDELPDLDDLENAPAGPNPLETKLSLAQEFEAIGDEEGARSLAEEVVKEATGDLQARAQAFLARLV